MNVLDLFSGIGAFSLGLERAGMRTVAFCEIDPYCRAVLKAHWPDVPIYADVTKLCRRVYDCNPENEDGDVICPRCGIEFGDCECIGTDQFLDEVGSVDVVCGGFPCQDVSGIGKRAGISGPKSGLWSQFHRIICELGPTCVLIENVSALFDRGLRRVLLDLDALGYVVQWHAIPASAIGAPHNRDRVWIIAYSRGAGLEGHAGHGDAERRAKQDRSTAQTDLLRGTYPAAWWQSKPGICRVADGAAAEVDRITALGNALVPQIAQMIGSAIMQAHA